MCYEFDRLYWLHRAEELRKEKEAEKLKRESATPAKPAAPEKEPELQEPLPA